MLESSSLRSTFPWMGKILVFALPLIGTPASSFSPFSSRKVNARQTGTPTFPGCALKTALCPPFLIHFSFNIRQCFSIFTSEEYESFEGNSQEYRLDNCLVFKEKKKKIVCFVEINFLTRNIPHVYRHLPQNIFTNTLHVG